VNLWIGDDRSVTSVHKDHYENMYAVVCGEKHFVILPPPDIQYLDERKFPQASYTTTNGGVNCTKFSDNGGDEEHGDEDESGWYIVKEDGFVKWCSVDPAYVDLDRHPSFIHASPFHVVVEQGDILYLPALWYHRVTSHGLTISVNYWHDMQFDMKYVYYNLIRDLLSLDDEERAAEEESEV
jgi:jumonji domain-containing protein 7